MSIRKHFILRLTHNWEPHLCVFQWIHLKQSKKRWGEQNVENNSKNRRGGQNRNESGQRRQTTLKTKLWSKSHNILLMGDPGELNGAIK